MVCPTFVAFPLSAPAGRRTMTMRFVGRRVPLVLWAVAWLGVLALPVSQQSGLGQSKGQRDDEAYG